MKKLLCTITIIIIFAIKTFAGTFGNTAGQILTSPASPRARSLGETMIGDTGAAEGFVYNPANLRMVENISFFASFTPIIPGLSLTTAGGAYNLEGIGIFGAYMKMILTPGVEVVEFRDNNLYPGKGSISETDLNFAGGYARDLNDFLSVGAMLNFLSMKSGDSLMWNMALNAGLIFELDNTPWNAGVSINNIGLPMEGSGETFMLPMSIGLGGIYNAYKIPKLTVDVMPGLNYYFNNNFSFAIGAEAKYSLFFLRLGSQFNGPNSGFQIGAGMQWKNIGIDYALAKTDLKMLNSYGVTVNIKKPKRVIWDLKENERIRIAVNDLLPSGVSGRIAAVISDIIRSELIKYSVFQVIERSMMAEILAEQELQLSGCTDNECAVKIGRLLSVRKIMIGELNKLGNKIIIIIRIVDVETGQGEVSGREKIGNIDDADVAVERLVKDVIKQVLPEDMK